MIQTAIKLAAVLLLMVGTMKIRAGEVSPEALAKMKAEIELLKNQKDVLIKSAENLRKELAESRKAVFNFTQQINVLRVQWAGHEKQVHELSKKLNRTSYNLTKVQKAHLDLKVRSKFNQAVIDELLKGGGIDTAVIKAVQLRMIKPTLPDISTLVVDVRPRTGHLALAAGSELKVKEGYIFIIERDGKYLGKARVTTVWKTFSGAVVVEKIAPFKPGDKARTQVFVKKPRKVSKPKEKPVTVPREKLPETF
jgi:hypothetical protein